MIEMLNLDDVSKIEVTLLKDFPIVRETLSRMGIKNQKSKKFFPSCYCVQHDDKYYIIHFKELFKATGRNSTYNELDDLRTQTIAYFLDKWNIVKLENKIESILREKIHILKRFEKDDYEIVHKFQMFKIGTQTRKVD